MTFTRDDHFCERAKEIHCVKACALLMRTIKSQHGAVIEVLGLPSFLAFGGEYGPKDSRYLSNMNTYLFCPKLCLRKASVSRRNGLDLCVAVAFDVIEAWCCGRWSCNTD